MYTQFAGSIFGDKTRATQSENRVEINNQLNNIDESKPINAEVTFISYKGTPDPIQKKYQRNWDYAGWQLEQGPNNNGQWQIKQPIVRQKGGKILEVKYIKYFPPEPDVLYIFVKMCDGAIRIAPRESNGHHFLARFAEVVLFAGDVRFDKNGKITEWTNASTSYQPSAHLYLQAGVGNIDLFRDTSSAGFTNLTIFAKAEKSTESRSKKIVAPEIVSVESESLSSSGLPKGPIDEVVDKQTASSLDIEADASVRKKRRTSFDQVSVDFSGLFAHKPLSPDSPRTPVSPDPEMRTNSPLPQDNSLANDLVPILALTSLCVR